MNTTLIKEAINKSFSQQASMYDAHAKVQVSSAQALADFLRTDADKIPQGPILELGCGTGIFTMHLLDLFPERVLTVSDVSQSMLARCQLLLSPVRERILFSLIDAEEVAEKEIALIAASFSLQWVTDFYATIGRLLETLKPDGQLVFSIPIAGSFSEWREQCSRTGVPFSANTLPEKSHLIEWCALKSLKLEWIKQPIVCQYDSALDFFKSLKGVGASVNTSGVRLTTSQLRRLVEEWDSNSNRKIVVTYNVLCGRITRGYDQ
ncbi:MAG: methyltransferase domain-containing protein [Cyanobacteria bacterium SZAS-4]|nr:methyltransferase domain-containing protein [Cyanobacteria bacterium SZAS-4]